MEEITGKSKIKSEGLPKMLKINEKKEFNEQKIAQEFNSFFTNIGPNLASKISPTDKSFESYLNKNAQCIENSELSFK